MEEKNPNSQGNKNYDLQSEAVEALVTDEVPEYSQEELNRYKRAKGFRFPEVLKILLLKVWFYGAVCYFVYWGLAMYLPGLIEMMFVLSVAMGMVTDLLLNSVIRFMEKTKGANDPWMFFHQRGVKGFALNLLYGFVIVFCVYNLYDGINRLAMLLTDTTNVIFLAVEPVLFGIFCMGTDMLFIAIKRLLASILRDALQAAKSR